MTGLDIAAGPPPPRENPELVGHAEAETVLMAAANSARLPHAWLISGPSGIGKATLAFRFARYLLSGGGEGPMAQDGLFAEDAALRPSLFVDPGHPVFHRVASGGHADLMTVARRADEKTGKMRTSISVDDVRGIGAFLSLTAAEGGWRVVIIDCADEMNPNSANAVLKVLEEPPRRSILLLVSHNPGRLLPTIRSRCRILRLKPLALDLVVDFVSKHRPSLTQEEITGLAHLSEGSLGRAIALADEDGMALYDEMMEILEGLPELDTARLHDFGGRLSRANADGAFHTTAELLRWWLGRLILAGAGAANNRDASASPRDKALMERLYRGPGLDCWLEVWEKVNRLLAKSDGANLDRKQVVLNVFHTLENAVRS